MTDSRTTQARGKRRRLIESAGELLHRQGVAHTTLAQVAEAAHVPPGNVYYYFKTKDELVQAVVDYRAAQVHQVFSTFDAMEATPSARLRSFLHNWSDIPDLIASQGCPIGGLCAELGKQDGGLETKGTELMQGILGWLTDQFRLAGRADARECAIALFSGVQGGALIANTLRDPDVFAAHLRYLEQWLDRLIETTDPPDLVAPPNPPAEPAGT